MAAKQRVWFITGASTGFGRLLAEEALKDGNLVVATARNVSQVKDLEQKYDGMNGGGKALALALDVTDQKQIDAAVDATLKMFGRADVIVNNAGYGLFGAVEEVSDEQIERVVNTNVYGLLRVTRAWLPHLRKQKSGHIINLSSIAGIASTQGVGIYNLTKYAVEGVSEALWYEVQPLGIHVTLIEPGPFRTDFAGRSLVLPEKEIEDYAETAGKTRANVKGYAGMQKGDPARAVRVMIDLVDNDNPPLRLLMGAFALNRFHTKMEKWQADVKQWEAVTLGTDFPD